MSMPNEPSGSSAGNSNIFTRKLGPLPMWAWMAVALVLAIAYYLYKKKSAAAAGAASSGTAANTPGGVDASLVPQFVNQTYTNTTPPTVNITTAPTVTPPATPAQTIPKTISGSPGSYTTGLPGGLNEWTSTGKYSLNTIAKSHGMTAQQLIASSTAAENNPLLAAYVKKGNYNAPLPTGIQVFIPNANWVMKK